MKLKLSNAALIPAKAGTQVLNQPRLQEEHGLI
jgi:hypothetical protein